MRRALMGATLATVLLGSAATTAYAAPGKEVRTFRYAAAQVGYSQLDKLTPGVSPSGLLRFTPQHRTITLTIDDAATLAGQSIAVSGRCIPVRTPTTLAGFKPGVEVVLMIMGDAEWLPGEPRPACTGHASAGSATVVL